MCQILSLQIPLWHCTADLPMAVALLVDALLVASAAWSVPPCAVAPRTVPLLSSARVSARTSLPAMVLPKAAALVAFLPWAFVIVVNNLPTDLRLRIQKSTLLQSGTTMRRMKVEPPKLRGRRLAPQAKEVAATFRKAYPTKEVRSRRARAPAPRLAPISLQPCSSAARGAVGGARQMLRQRGAGSASS